MAKRQYRNILIIKPGAIGDTLQLTPVIRACNRAFPRARISVLVGSAGMQPLFAHNPAVHETIVFEKQKEQRSFAALLGVWRRIRAARYDLVLNFQRSNLRTWLLVTAALPCRLLIYHKSRDRTVHAVDNYLATVAPLGITNASRELEMPLGAQERASAASLLENLPRPIIVLNPGASHAVNRWEPGRFAELADLLATKLKASLILIGGPGDQAAAAEINRSAAKAKPLILTGKTDLQQLGAVLERSDVLVTGDTGPMHIATAVGATVVALFGAADPARTGPVGPRHRVVQADDVPCVPCRSRTCAHQESLACMKHITPERVFKIIDEALTGRSSV